MSFAAVGGAVAGAAVSVGLSSALNSGSDRAANRANNAAADATALQSQIAAEQWDRYTELYDPLERQFVTEAQNYDSPSEYVRAAGDASATVAREFGKARERLGRTPGLDPSSPAYAAALGGLDLAEAATGATQQNAARQKVKDTAYVRKTDALSLGKGLPAQASNMLTTATRNNLGLAELNTATGLANSNALGNVVNRVINPTTVNGFKNWLNSGTSSAPVGTGSLDVGDVNTYVNNYESSLPTW